MKNVLLACAVALLTACQQQKQDELDTIAVAAPGDIVKPLMEDDDSLPEPRRDINWDQIEVFPLSRALINHKVPLFTTRQHLEAAIGKADSIVATASNDVSGSQFAGDFHYFYKDGATFELCRDSLACDEFIFTTGNSLTVDNITLTQNTTWEDIRKIFPRAAIQAENEGRTDVIKLRDSFLKDEDSQVQLYFENGKLARVVNFIPC
ncbi:hypothetical protein FHW36_11280 [Chitinophaga polysaccharea]|uniref:Lipoprotein n=1 Tax=Chitinophaga polysaccharea TaxID=1293035 RepID=A0A561P6A6_9BACT|nr:hypothetical protein [Chitinophaga polysaccharea]TWF33639.1 hypothetical protein FHW36_11280 [Chitinophaga polysaccharea]